MVVDTTNWSIRVCDGSTAGGKYPIASSLATGRTIAISGGATGTATSFDGGANITIPVTALDVSKATAGTLATSRGGTGCTDGKVTALATTRYIDGVGFTGAADVIHYGSCSTDAATVEKVVACTNYALKTGGRITVKFTVTNTAANPTLNVNSTGAKAIYYRGTAIGTGYLVANRTYEFVYNGTQYELVGDINTDTNTKVTQTLTTTNAEYAILGMADAAATANKTNTTRFASAITINPRSGAVTAKKHIGTISAYGTDTAILSAKSDKSERKIISVTEPSADLNYGKNVEISSGGVMIIGAGESPDSCTNELKASTSEEMYIVSDNTIKFYTGANTYANKKTSTIDGSGNLTCAG